jgi:hypothetical protein
MKFLKLAAVSILLIFSGSFSKAVVREQLTRAESIAIDAKAVNYQNGDLIFQNSISQQSPAIEEVQGNPWTHVGVLFQKNKKWYVYEAIGPVQITPLKEFIRSGVDKIYDVRRINPTLVDLSDKKLQEKLYNELVKFDGISYDLFFQWSDERIYCSELTYKAFDAALGIKVGPLVKLKELNLSGPLARQLVKAREELLGGPANLEEDIVTPGAQHDDPQLITVD